MKKLTTTQIDALKLIEQSGAIVKMGREYSVYLLGGRQFNSSTFDALLKRSYIAKVDEVKTNNIFTLTYEITDTGKGFLLSI